MPTKHARIPVTCDTELADALRRVEGVLGAAPPRATLVRDLALRGAEAYLQERAGRSDALRLLADLSTRPDPPFDAAVLRRVRDEAWAAPTPQR